MSSSRSQANHQPKAFKEAQGTYNLDIRNVPSAELPGLLHNLGKLSVLPEVSVDVEVESEIAPVLGSISAKDFEEYFTAKHPERRISYRTWGVLENLVEQHPELPVKRIMNEGNAAAALEGDLVFLASWLKLNHSSITATGMLENILEQRTQNLLVNNKQ